MVLTPIDANLEISFKSEIPLISEAKISGTAISFRSLTKIVPRGFIQDVTNASPSLNLKHNEAKNNT